MTDNISRRAVLDRLNKCEFDENIFGCDDYEYGRYQMHEFCTNVVRDQPSADRWIPCSERLPEDVEIGEEYPTVIFCTKDAVYVGFYEYYRGGRWWAAEEYTVDNVIAWMPLPEPYKKSNEKPCTVASANVESYGESY